MKTNPEAINTIPSCSTCSSNRVVRSAWSCFNPDSGLWELEALRDREYCHNCVATTQLVWSNAEQPPNQRIRELNDLFRTHGVGEGTVLITSGIQGEGSEFVSLVVEAVRTFADFNDNNDPWGEHDFGAVDVAGQKVFFKLDYYADDSLASGSENPANAGMTHRVLTILLANEY